jgi:hypothetical protein
MAKKAFSINFPVERAVLSDVLPYEVPIIFSNRNYYRFICEHSLKLTGTRVVWRHKDEVLDNLVKMLLGVQLSSPVKVEVIQGEEFSLLDLAKHEVHSVPFTFSTTHKQDQLRQLSLMHPKAQLLVVDFYHEFKDLIVHYANRSDFSLRSPKRVAGCTYIDFGAQIELGDQTDTVVEVEGDNYENLRSFFVYERFSNVFKFYESTEHLACEREYKYLSKLDISSCFDSIYTHSMAWAVYGKEFSKANLSDILGSFPGRFDFLMQKLNYNETNGILIGPEISRIFAEIILQAVDVEVCARLLNKGIVHGKDFRVYRYVDDFFVFYNDEESFHQVKMTLQECLKVYKLSLNKGKEETLRRPIITPISIAKKQISDLFDRVLTYNLAEEVRDGETLPRGSIYIGKSSLITEFKSILSESGVGYGDILNYSFSVIERKVGSLIKMYERIEKDQNSGRNFTKSIDAILGFVFFIYAVSPKVNTTIKLCRICQRIIAFYQKNPIGFDYGAIIYQVIYEGCRRVLSINQNSSEEKIEVMYLLVLMRQLGSNYRIDEVTLGKCFGFELVDDKYRPSSALNYFSIITLLFYIENKSRYSRLLSALQSYVVDKFQLESESLAGNSEMIHLALDLLTCPYISKRVKLIILSLYGIPSNNLLRMQNYSDYWFAKWGGFDFSKELDAKVSQEVY